ncbi:TspO/MBR family protein [Streptomyces sp. WG-D5]
MRRTRKKSAPYAAQAAVVGGVIASAALGSAAVTPDGDWYKALNKPSWQPPGWAFPVVWTPLYASVAVAGVRALNRADAEERRRVARALAANLTLNTAWNWLFFGLRNPAAGVLGTLALDASNLHLVRRVAATDRTAARTLWPYAAWCGFATALNASIAWRNRK